MKEFSENYVQFGHKPALSKNEKDEWISVLRSAKLLNCPGCRHVMGRALAVKIQVVFWWRRWWNDDKNEFVQKNL